MFSRRRRNLAAGAAGKDEPLLAPMIPVQVEVWPSETTPQFRDPFLGDFALTRPQPPNEGLRSPAFVKWYLGDFAA